MGTKSRNRHWSASSKIKLIEFILFIIIIWHNFNPTNAAACKGCAPPCVCPGTKGERVKKNFYAL